MASVKPINMETLLRKPALDAAMESDADYREQEDVKVMWYHGNLSRACTEKLLFEALEKSPQMSLDGVFLVRGVSTSDTDYSLSFIYQQRCYHYYIHCIDGDFFRITEGPKIHGLDQLIEHYIEAANHLPTRLTSLCKGALPPARVRRRGPTNLLHSAVAQGRKDVTAKILNHRLCPDIDAKNEEGMTVLHIAVGADLSEIVSLLLAKGADISIRDAEGATPLFRACMKNSLKSVQLLVKHDQSCVHEKSPASGWVPLHAAAMSGHKNCAKILLDANAALCPRGQAGDTPLDVAEKYHRNVCLAFLENYQEKVTFQARESEWLYPDLDRQGTEQLFNQCPKTPGLFLVRHSKTNEGQLVLTVYDGMSLFHYAILSKNYRGTQMYYLDDGPLHKSLQLLLQHYHTCKDGLTCRLQAPVSPDADPAGQDYESCSSPSPPGHPRPKLPPRPPGLDSPPCPPSPSPREPPVFSSPTKYTHHAVEEATENQQEEPLTEIARKDLQLGSELGQGEFGSVLRGTLVVKHKRFGRSTKVDVAIKVFHSVGDKSEFEQEATVMQRLRHEYIVELKGVCYDNKCFMLVEEFIPMGSMLDFLEENPEKVRVKQELYLWAAQIARGMMYLESKRLVHRDLAARNILLASMEKVKISDFGLSRAMGTDKEYYKASKGGRWPIKWYAPESVNYGHFSLASDVWSYGVTLWEMFSFASAPYDQMSGMEVIQFIENGERLQQPPRCPNMVYQTMLKCWSYEPQDRPTFSWLDQHFGTEDEYLNARELMQQVMMASLHNRTKSA